MNETRAATVAPALQFNNPCFVFLTPHGKPPRQSGKLSRVNGPSIRDSSLLPTAIMASCIAYRVRIIGTEQLSC